jgi:hypothetical protein
VFESSILLSYFSFVDLLFYVSYYLIFELLFNVLFGDSYSLIESFTLSKHSDEIFESWDEIKLLVVN